MRFDPEQWIFRLDPSSNEDQKPRREKILR